MRLVPRAFYGRDPRRVARELLGKVLVRRGRRGGAGRIVEVEAYLGKGDAAAHAAAGPTARNRVLFGPPGHAYVYFIYGNHHCLNVSCQPEGEAGCVLLRALQPLPPMAPRRVHAGIAGLRQVASGPGRLCKSLGITRADNGKDLTVRSSDLVIADDGYRPRRIVATPRIGIRKAAEKRLRFVVAGNPFVSGAGSAAARKPKGSRG